jgi:hypothetical protein
MTDSVRRGVARRHRIIDRGSLRSLLSHLVPVMTGSLFSVRDY